MDWRCTNDQCDSSGAGYPPDECPSCTWPTTLAKDGFLSALRVHRSLIQRAEHIAALLGHGSEHITFDDTHESGTFEVEWQTYCGRGCCSPETHTATIPLRYLWTDDATILAEETARKEAEARAKAEAAHAEKIRVAEQRLATARAAAQSLAAVEAELQTLKAGSP